MTEWEPATETEAAMRDALRAGDQELYFRLLARTDLLLPVSAEALAGRAPMGWGTWTTGGRTHVLAFTSGAALHACLAENAGSTRLAPYPELAGGWPNPEWWLAVNPGLPIEGYLPAWFVSQLSRGDVRLPGRSIGARARLEQVERAAARARATAAVPRRTAPGGSTRTDPEPSRTPDTPFQRSEPPRTPAEPYLAGESFREPAEPLREPAESFRASAESFREPAESDRASTSSVGAPATVPVIAPIPEPGDRGTDFGSQITADTSAGWMTPAGPGRSGTPTAPHASTTPAAPATTDPPTARTARTTPNGGPPAAAARSTAPADPTGLAGAGSTGPPPVWHASADQPTTPNGGPAASEDRSTVGRTSAAVSPGARPPEPWTSTPVPAEESLFTPMPRRSAGGSWSGDAPAETRPGEPSSGYRLSGDPSAGTATAYDPTSGGRMPDDSARTQPVRLDPARTEAIFSSPAPAGPLAPGSFPTEPIRAESIATESSSSGPAGGVGASGDPGGSGPSGVAEPIATGPAPAEPARLPADFVPANDVERSLLDAAGDGSTDTFLSTLLLARVLLPVAAGSSPGARPGDDGFEWRTEALDGETYVVVFTSPERLGDHLPGSVETVTVKFAQLIRRWPDDAWSFAVNPGTPVGAKLPGGQIVALANWAAEVGLGDDAEAGDQAPSAPAEEEAPRSTYAPAREDPGQPTVMQKTIAPSQLSYYLDRGYDRVSGFVHRASEVAHLRTPAKLYTALGLGYPDSPFARDADEIYVLRWPAYRPSLYRIPYGGQSEPAMRAMEGWVIERPPFRGNGFAPGESSDVVAEFKVDSVRLPHGAELCRIGIDGTERVVATLDCDVPVWRRVEEA